MQTTKWRWLMAGSFTTAPTGRRTVVSGERFATVMKNLGVDAPVTLPSSLGEAVSGPVPLQFARPRMFRVDDVIAAIEPLAKLEALATALTKEKDLAPAVVAARIERIVGPGGLATRFQPSAENPDAQAQDDVPPPPSSSSTPQASGAQTTPPDNDNDNDNDDNDNEDDEGVSDIFSRVELPGQTEEVTVKAGLDAFVHAMRGPGAQVATVDASVRLDAAKEIRLAITQAAMSILGQPAIARLESAWRGLKMIMAASPGHDHLAIDLLDVDPAGIVEALERNVRADDPQCPNAIFIGIALPPTTLQAVAELAERLQVPVVVGVSKTLTGPAWREEDPHVAPDWTALRAMSCADWLCAAANPVVVANEDTAAGPRVVPTSAAWGVAAILASAVSRGGDLRGTQGPAGAVVAPAAHEVDLGFSEPRTIPTRRYANADTLKRAAEHGVMLLGSGAGSDQFLIATNAMAGRGGLTKRIQASASLRG